MPPAILFVLSILVAPVGPGLRAQAQPSGEATIVRVFFDDLPTGRLIAAGLEPIESKYEKGYLVVEVTAERLRHLQRLGLRTEPVSTLELSTILASPRVIRSDQAPEQAPATAKTGIPNYPCYRTVEETFAAAESLVENNPTLAGWVDVGDSWLKTAGKAGYDMRVLVLTNANVSGSKPKMFVTSSLHPREIAPAELTTRFAESLVSNYGVVADATWLLDHHEIHLMLQANPDGRKLYAEWGIWWRKNVNENYCAEAPSYRGADLNRNFDFMWDCCGGSSDSQCSFEYHGASPASEPEVLSVQNYIRSIFPDQRGPNLTDAAPDDATGIYLDIHSSGRLILHGWHFTTETPAPNAPQLQTLAHKLAYFNRYTPVQATERSFVLDGIAADFGYGEMGLASFTYEIGTRFFEHCDYFENTLLPRNMPSLYYAAKVARTPYMTPSGPNVVEGSLSLSAGDWPAVVTAGTSVTLSATLSDSQFNNSSGTEPTQSVEAAEYYIDTPPWVTTPVPEPLPMVDQDGDVYETSVDTTGLSAGQHIVFVRGKDSDQNWGAFSAIFLGIKRPIAPPPRPPGGGGPRTSAPGAPRNLTAVGGDGQVVLTWDAPADDGGAEITDYEYRIDRRNPWISIGSTDTTYTVTGLVNGTSYVFEVRAVNAAGRSASTNRAEATPELFTLDFAHFANGDGIASDLVFVNLAPHPIRPAIYFYDTGGALVSAESVVDITGDLEVQEDGGLTVLTEMEPLGELTISTHGQGELVSGSVRVVAFGAIGGMLRFDLPGIGVAGVGASPPVSDALFPVRRQEAGINTGVAIHNLESSAEIVRCELMREGVLHDAVSIPLAANGQSSWFINAAFPAADTSDFAGSVHCDAADPGMFTAVALELDAASRIFTTLPVLPTRRAGGRAAELNFAHFANGAGLTSDLVFVNLSTERSRPAPTPFHSDILPARPAIYFYDTEGAPVSAESLVDITGDLEVMEDGGLTVRTEMQPLGVLTISTHGRGELVSGSVRVVADEPIGGVLRFDLPGIGVAGVGVSSPVRDAIFPVRRQEAGINTGVAIHNLESSPEIVRCDLMQGGTVLDDVSLPLAANGQSSWFINEVFTGADTSDFVGSVRCTAPGEGMFTGVAVELDAANRIFTTLPVVPVKESTDRE